MLINSLKYSLHVIFHPFDGFWDLKHEKRGNAKAATILVLLLVFVRIFKRQATGFIFNTNDIKTLNVMYELRFVVLSLLIWCVSNWCLTSLMDGEGSFKDIYITTAYAMTPMIIIYFPLTILSNFLLIEEKEFYTFFNGLAMVWFCWLLWIGIMTVHQYTVKKTIITIFLTLASMGIIIFLGLVSLQLFEWVSRFVVSVIREVLYRM